MTRRKLLCSVSVLALSGCVSQITDTALSTLITKVTELVGGLSALPSWLAGLLPVGGLAKITGLVSQLVALGRSIAAAASIKDALPLVGQLASLVDAILAVIPPGALPEKVTKLLSAASTYLPIILALVGLFAAPRAARFAAMSEAEARGVLLAAAGR